ncbi:Crp/Fnr family transcriptional regulator [Chitinophagaceae bacterium LB-8]|uniref:Crp/Fnr family transcriptional regulator n=1 Tax=Paraflavisolibacter caeni TaxID=2982496 RepID=A0A9X3B9B8_9BACT|nr:Crp/Fnr family transcriptional regulator [Paraflavisolibacter caeni]MCU7550986.1 Crp/Fnr family transcriptional regulator [Paraflavisolibacter caeni]
MDYLKSTINKISFLNDEEWSLLSGFIQTKTLSKNEYLLKEGQYCDSIAYINSGVLIYFKFFENGKEITIDFAFDGDWVTDNLSRLKNEPSSINIKAIENTEVFMIKQKDIQYLFERIPQLERLGRILMEQAFIKIAQHSIDLQVLSAKERYKKMLQNYPVVFQKVPLYHIANYLGVAPKSLSRIRNELSK